MGSKQQSPNPNGNQWAAAGQGDAQQNANTALVSEELANLKKEYAVKEELSNKLRVENNKMSAEVSNLKYQQSHDREQLNALKKRNDANESKISAYNASFIELAEKLKQLNDDTKVLRKDKDKARRKCEKLEKAKKKMKGQIKGKKKSPWNLECFF